ncbi:nucleoside triphosphate pyrophosphohydrolase [Stackebrandtia nassauensis]|uniref:MazG family protein n=1 Tax=Stackebrandtia nassauensis (strain DSM 44728 / CIP 108903 / NRRL B-16338 / NBRC 102104 / LLR-40K-21) TaxID=446470 RepID=D3PZ11_STANL|nr:nucleoside triphosphate pyrophosphohydrolase [Stackebrandtia nassauensis]ADD45440.1 MazG family protein [Stackebrandtia nassauensis DSM 44728]
MTVTIHWLVTTPRLPAGMLTLQAWDALRASESVYAAPGNPQLGAVRAAGIDVTELSVDDALDTLLERGGLWLTTAEDDEPVAKQLSVKLAADPSLATVEITFGSWDPPGARLLDLVAVIDRLRSPGGCPWDREQTHESLAPFLLEEAYETIDAIHSGDLDHLREELGDLLMQPLLHARLAAEDEDGFTIDDVVADVVEKLVRRHPHVFADARVDSIADLNDTWDALKRAEKPHRKFAVDGVALSQPALSLAAKLLSRTSRENLDVPLPETAADPASSEAALGAALLGLVAAARAAGLDPELALRKAALDFADRSRAVESGNKSG